MFFQIRKHLHSDKLKLDRFNFLPWFSTLLGDTPLHFLIIWFHSQWRRICGLITNLDNFIDIGRTFGRVTPILGIYLLTILISLCGFGRMKLNAMNNLASWSLLWDAFWIQDDIHWTFVIPSHSAGSTLEAKQQAYVFLIDEAEHLDSILCKETSSPFCSQEEMVAWRTRASILYPVTWPPNQAASSVVDGYMVLGKAEGFCGVTKYMLRYT